jgi:hypothetical protein
VNPALAFAVAFALAFAVAFLAVIPSAAGVPGGRSLPAGVGAGVPGGRSLPAGVGARNPLPPVLAFARPPLLATNQVPRGFSLGFHTAPKREGALAPEAAA